MARRTSLPRRILALALAALTVLATAGFGASPAEAQPVAPWPQRPVRLVVPYGPGSSPDVFGRLLAERLTARLGQPVLVENRAGAGGNLGTGHVARAAPDGYTLLVSTNGPLVNNTVLYRKLGYDPVRELAPIVIGGGQANVCAVRPDAGIDSMKSLVDALRRTPGGLNFSSIGVGSLSHLGVELLKVRTGTFAVHIPYPSSPAAITALMQGDVQFSCVPAVAVMPQVRAGKLRALAVTTPARSPLMPEVPTFREQGFPDVEAVAWMAVMAPAQTPDEILERLNREINASLPEIRERMHAQFMEPVGGSIAQAQRFLAQELRTWTPIIQRSGASVD